MELVFLVGWFIRSWTMMQSAKVEVKGRSSVVEARSPAYRFLAILHIATLW